MTFQNAWRPVAVQIPHSNRVVIRTGDDLAAVIGLRYSPDLTVMAFQDTRRPVAVQIPHPHGFIPRAGDDPAAIPRQRHGQVTRSLWPCRARERPIAVQIPHPHGLVKRNRRRPGGRPRTAPQPLQQSLWPSRTRGGTSLSRSHTLMVLSPEPETTRRPSADSATAITQSAMAFQNAWRPCCCSNPTPARSCQQEPETTRRPSA